MSGRGGFGSVFLARGPDKKKVAIKKMVHTKLKQKRSNIDEVIFMKECDHPNIVKYERAFELPNEIWVVMEFLEGGTLSEAVESCKFEEGQVAYVAREMLKGIAYLHSKGFVHRDLKSGNVMMSVDGDLKLIDFGLCIDATRTTKHMVGSPFWIPPEMILRIPHGIEADIWSFAICLLEMINRKPPNRKSSIKAMFVTATGDPPTAESPKDWSDNLHDFLSLCLKKNPAERATAEQLLQHPFLNITATKSTMKNILMNIFVEKSLEKSLGL